MMEMLPRHQGSFKKKSREWKIRDSSEMTGNECGQGEYGQETRGNESGDR